MMMNGWEPREDTPGGYERTIDARTYCAITNYAGSDDYCWHVIRGDARLHAIIHGSEAAMKKADEIMALPIDEFNARAVAVLINEIREIERQIMRIGPHADILPGYQAGYEAGIADIKRKIAAAIDLYDEAPSA